MHTKRSVSTRIAKYLFIILIVAGVISSLSLAIISSNKYDAKAINISGSLRMQSYRLLYEMRTQPESIENNLRRYQVSLHSSALLETQNQFFTPKAVKLSYQTILRRWAIMEKYARQYDVKNYSEQLTDYVADVDHFVFELQRFSEQKWILGVSVLFFRYVVNFSYGVLCDLVHKPRSCETFAFNDKSQYASANASIQSYST